MKKALSLALVCLMAYFPIGCNADQVVAGLDTAQKVAQQAQTILAPVNPEVANIMGRVSTDLAVVVKAYKDYDTAAGDKPTKADLVRATSAAITGDLAQILDAVRVKNPQLLTEITVAVAVVNSAITVLLAKVPSSATQPHAAVIQSQQLPVIANAKSAKDLKRAWNDAVRKSFPKAKI